MKKKLVYVLLYSDSILAVCSSRSIARKLAKTHVIELDYVVDKFQIFELPLL